MTRLVLVLFMLSSSLALSCSGKELKELIDNISQLQERVKQVKTPIRELDNMNGEQFAAFIEKDIMPLALKVDQVADFILQRKKNPNTPADEKQCLNKYCDGGSPQNKQQPHFANGDYKIITHEIKTISDEAYFCLDHCYDEKDGKVVSKESNKPIEPQPTMKSNNAKHVNKNLQPRKSNNAHHVNNMWAKSNNAEHVNKNLQPKKSNNAHHVNNMWAKSNNAHHVNNMESKNGNNAHNF